LLALFAALASAAAGAAYPDRPIRIIVAFAAGSGNDVVGRIVAEELRKELDAQVVVENRPGAAGVIGMRAALQAPADGYTLVMTSSATHSANPWLVRDLPYEPVKSFAHISNVITTPLLLVVPQGSASTMKEFLDKSRGKDVPFGFGSSTSQVAASAFANIAGLTTTPVSYKSQPPALVDLTSGLVQFMFADAAALGPFLQGNKVTPLATTGATRSPKLPNVPTLAELGVKDYDLTVWVGIAAPAGTPPEIVKQLSDALARGLARHEVRDRFAVVGMQIDANGPEKQREFVEAQLGAWKRRIQEAGLKPE